MAKTVNRIDDNKPVNLTPGMFFQCNRSQDIYTVVYVKTGWYLVNIDNGYEWDGTDVRDSTVKEVEVNEHMTWMNVKQVIFE